MQTLIFIYRNPARYAPTPETSAGMKAWFAGMECPHLTRNGGIEVGQLGEVPAAGRLPA